MAESSIGTRILEARKRAGMRQRDLAAASDLDVMQISRWERGVTKTPTAASLEKLASALKVSVDWLLTGREAAA